jgi:hypothetical protein
VQPSVVIAANPYEAELCRRALVETGLRVVVAEGGEGVLELIGAEPPLVLVIALGLFGVEPLELLREARLKAATLPIFLIGDRDGEVPDEDAAALVGATRLFLRPIDSEALADAIEKRAVEAEVADEVAEAMAEFSVRPPTLDEDLDDIEELDDSMVEEAIVEMEADFESPAPKQQVARISLRRLAREATEVLEVSRPRTRFGEMMARADAGEPPRASVPEPSLASLGAAFDAEPEPMSEVILQPDESALQPFEVTLPPLQAPPRIVTEVMRPNAPMEPPEREPFAAPPPSVALPDGGTRPRIFGEPRRAEPAPLLRADDALNDAAGLGLQAMAVAPDFVADERRTPFNERSTLARRLEHELSAAERRLFPDSPSTIGARAVKEDEYEDALGDIDLDRLGIDTIPGVGGDALEALRPRNGHTAREEPESRLAPSAPTPVPAPAPARHDEFNARPPTLPRASLTPLPELEGDLARSDIATLVAALHGAGFSGRLSVTRGDSEKALFFDGGLPVFAASSLAHDRLVELVYRDGKINRDQLARARTLPDGGRLAAQKLVEMGLIKSSELFATMRLHVEEIVYSLFAWDAGSYLLTRELASPEDRVRLGAAPWAVVLEGVRRKYALERLVELVGPPDTVLAPTVTLVRALDECALTPAERGRAEAIDGERSLAEIALGGGPPLSEAGLYALAWGLAAIGAVRIGSDAKGALAADLPTRVTPADAIGDRRGRPRPESRARDRAIDTAVDKERVLAKRAQVEESDYFTVLGLGRDATSYEIARAFERLKREFAPDRFVESVRGELAAALSEIAEVLDEAQRVLGDEQLRRAYRSRLPSS